MRDIKIRYRRSVLGLVWTVLNPLLMMMVMSIVFQNIFKMTIDNFPVYVMIGNIVFSFHSEATSQALMSILSSASLIKKVYIPKYLFPLSKVLSSVVNFTFSFIALILVMLITKSTFHPTIITFWIPLLYLLVFATGFGFILSAVNVYFRDVGHLYSVALTAWMYFTPIFYSIDILSPELKVAIQWNPIYHYVTFFREILMNGVFPGLQENLICIAYSLGTFALGMFVFAKLQDRFILHL